MKIGKYTIETCDDCPSLGWDGRCKFGSFNVKYNNPKKIPEDCPIKNQIDTIEKLKEMRMNIKKLVDVV